MDRKYKQAGYQDDQPRDTPKPQPRPKDREGPRSPKMMAFQGVMRCGMCGNEIKLDLFEFTPTSQCPKCSADLRTCRNCVHFDPSARFECRATIEKRISGKTTRNECTEFSPRKTVEKKTGESRSSTNSSSRNDPRSAFENLFKK